MININGKMVTILGFAIMFLVDLAHVCLGFGLNINILHPIALFIIAGGFGIQWLNDRDNINFLSAGTVGIAALIYLFQVSLYLVVSSLYFFVMALRALRFNKTGYNRLVSLAFICAGLYRIFGIFIVLWLGRIFGVQWYYMIGSIVSVVCSGICLLESLQEN